MKKLILSLILILLTATSAMASDGGAQFIAFGPYFSASSVLYPTPKIYHYAAGTSSTLKNCWSDEGKVTAVAQPYVGDAYGVATMYCDGDYKFVVKDVSGNILYTWDNYKVTSDTATMWEGNFGTSYPTAATTNRWQMFAKVTASNEFKELGINTGAQFIPLTNTVSVKGYGAKCDNSTDDTTAIQSAIDDMTAGVVAITEGTCISDGITLKANVYLYIAGGATLKQKGTGEAQLVDITDVSNTGVFGEGTLDGNAALTGSFDAHCVRIYAETVDIENIVIKDVTIKNCTATATASGDGIFISSDSSGIYKVKSSKILHTHIADTDRNGITVYGYLIDSIIDSNTIDSVTTTGIDFEPGYDTQIPQGNVISHNTTHGGVRGVDIMGQNNIFTDNIFNAPSSHGIFFSGHATKICKRNTASNNRIILPGGVGIQIGNDTMGWNRAIDNDIYMGVAGAYGIRITTGTSNKYNKISGGTIIDNQSGYESLELMTGGAGYQEISDIQFVRDSGTNATAIQLSSTGNNIVINNKFIGSFTNEINGIVGTDSITQIPRIIDKATDSGIETWHTGTTFTNIGAADTTYIYLPSAIIGLEYTFVRLATQAFRLDPIVTEFIAGGGAGKFLSLDSNGAVVKLQCQTPGQWIIIHSIGTTNFEP